MQTENLAQRGSLFLILEGKERGMLEQGTVLEGRYEVKGRLGEGGTSQVYAAYDREKRRNRAIKEVMAPPGSQELKRQVHNMVQREVGLIKKLKYPYFPELEEVIEKEGASYLVMEYLEGETLAQVLARSGPQPYQKVVRWARDMCLVLGYLHNCQPPIIYRDMKPGNVMLQPGGNLRLIDFGAVWELAPNLAGSRVSLGTRGYAAPEQLNGGEVGPMTDIYGLGATMRHLLTGEDPCKFQSEKRPIGLISRPFPRKLGKIVCKCTRQEPKERYQSCMELKEDLENFANRKRLWYNNQVEK